MLVQADKIDAVNAAAAATSPVAVIGADQIQPPAFGAASVPAAGSHPPRGSQLPLPAGAGAGAGPMTHPAGLGRAPRTTPTANVPELIVFALDLSDSMDTPTSNFKKVLVYPPPVHPC